eukprot:scaffold2404_cov398-Prasinococcus_capsulatus_cf.AAC.24
MHHCTTFAHAVPARRDSVSGRIRPRGPPGGQPRSGRIGDGAAAARAPCTARRGAGSTTAVDAAPPGRPKKIRRAPARNRATREPAPLLAVACALVRPSSFRASRTCARLRRATQAQSGSSDRGVASSLVLPPPPTGLPRLPAARALRRRQRPPGPPHTQAGAVRSSASRAHGFSCNVSERGAPPPGRWVHSRSEPGAGKLVRTSQGRAQCARPVLCVDTKRKDGHILFG